MSTVSRTTIRLDEQLLRDSKKAAAEAGISLTALIEDGLREILARRREGNSQKTKFVMPTLDLGPPLPGVDLENNAALLDLMEEGDDPF
jgi:hypothetical protein